MFHFQNHIFQHLNYLKGGCILSQNSNNHTEEELALGRLFKQLRLAKGFSQEEAAGFEVSTTHISNFENGKTIIGLHHFIKILQNINVNMFEFQNSLNQYLHEKDILLFNTELTDAVVEQNASKLKQILTKLEHQINKSLKSPSNKKMKLDYIRTKSALFFIDSSYSLTKKEMNFLENYLFHLKEWGQYDIALLGQCAQFLNFISLMDLTNNMISPTQENIKIPYIKQAIIQTVLNIINVFVNNHCYDYAKRLIHYLESSDIHDYYMFEKLTLIYNTANYQYHSGHKEAIETMKKCQEVLEFCNCSKTANWINSEIKNIVNDN